MYDNSNLGLSSSRSGSDTGSHLLRQYATLKTLILSLLLCAAASAQTLEYTSAPMIGEIESLNTGASAVTLTAVTGFLTAEVVLQGSVLTSYGATFVASNGQQIPLYTAAPFFGVTGEGSVAVGNTFTSFTGNTLTVQTDAQGNATGATMGFNENLYHNGWTQLGLGGAGGDMFSFLTDSTPNGDGTCENQLTGGAYTGGGVASCMAYATSTAKGTWTVRSAVSAPEFDWKGSMEVCLLLAGGLAVVRGRRRA
jgi:hypothetical protein